MHDCCEGGASKKASNPNDPKNGLPVAEMTRRKCGQA
jgi:hypothetical protein